MSSTSPIILSELPLPVHPHPHPRAQRNTHHHDHTPRASRHQHASRARTPYRPAAAQIPLPSPTPRYPPSALLAPASVSATRFAARAGAPDSDWARSASRVSAHAHASSNVHCGGQTSHAAPHCARYEYEAAATTATAEEDEAAFLYETFVVTGSRVLRVLNAQPTLAAALARLRAAMAVAVAAHSVDTAEQTQQARPPIEIEMRVWTRRGAVWVVFATHEEARLALALSSHLQHTHSNSNAYIPPPLALEPALHTDLEPYDTLQVCPLEYEDEDLDSSLISETDTDWNLRTTAPAYTHSHTPTYAHTPTATATTTMHHLALDLDVDAFDFALAALTPDDAPASPESSGGPRTPQDFAGYAGEYEYVFGGNGTGNAKIGSKIGNGNGKIGIGGETTPAAVGFTLSSNPPNPKTSFRAGDWLCPLPACGAHNFGRNMSCIGCGSARPYGPAPLPLSLPPQHPHARPTLIAIPPPPLHAVSPRFMSPVSPLSPTGTPGAGARMPGPAAGFSRNPSPARTPGTPALKPPAPSYPLLTPSGHALSAGGRVRNISNDPLAPCIMYWPDNEPLPDRGQIRPQGSTVVQYPPIINTGNKGAAEKQPGDWICRKCNYLNWRRRKVCQTCYPYAEGNGDSISQAVQAERIALLTNVLNQVEPPSQLQRRASMPVHHTPTHVSGYTSAPTPSSHAHTPSHPIVRPGPAVARARSQMDLRTQYQFQQQQQRPEVSRPIYQTPVYSPRGVSPASVRSRVPSPTSALLPSCLQDVVQVQAQVPRQPALVPAQASPATSSSSADLSFEEYDLAFNLAEEYQYLSEAYDERVFGNGNGANAAAQPVSASIWKLDGEETRTMGMPPRKVSPDASMLELAGRMAHGLALVN